MFVTFFTFFNVFICIWTFFLHLCLKADHRNILRSCASGANIFVRIRAQHPNDYIRQLLNYAVYVPLRTVTHQLYAFSITHFKLPSCIAQFRTYPLPALTYVRQSAIKIHIAEPSISSCQWNAHFSVYCIVIPRNSRSLTLSFAFRLTSDYGQLRWHSMPSGSKNPLRLGIRGENLMAV